MKKATNSKVLFYYENKIERNPKIWNVIGVCKLRYPDVKKINS